MKRLSPILLLACVIPTSMHGQRVEVPVLQQNATTSLVELARIRGVIVDAYLARIPNSNLLLQRKERNEFRDVKSVKSDKIGGFEFEEALPGTYRLIASAPGFCEVTIPIRLSKSGWSGLKLTLPVGATDTPLGYCPSEARIEQLEK